MVGKRGRPKGNGITVEEYRKRQRESARNRLRKYRLEAIQHYGPNCECCGESEPRFLSLDHSHGKENKKETGSSFLSWLRVRGWPEVPGLRVLCWNCHLAKDFYGGCPHQGEERKLRITKPLAPLP